MTAAETNWTDRAPCRGDLRFAPADGPAASRFAMLADVFELLALCRDCPFRSECIARVAPSQSGFDGVCGGHLWLDGRAIASAHGIGPAPEEPPLRAACGTPAGARSHSRHGERACSACRQAQRDYQRERRRRRRAQEAAKFTVPGKSN
ncbi:hypothetical protein AB0O82_10590 [Kitasatospora sp. NPDC088264]|uniref:hypothetical protein n=1 Tax=Kitasatospora sp. NPDC088264 TaxID=3155296 RepID=UPI003417C3E2